MSYSQTILPITTSYSQKLTSMGFRLTPVPDTEITKFIEMGLNEDILFNYADQLGVILKKHIDFTKNIAVPAIERVKNILEEKKKLAETRPIEENFNIVQNHIPDPIINSGIMDEINEYNDISIVRPNKTLPPLMITDDQLKEMASGSSSLDNDLVKWAIFSVNDKLKETILGFFSCDSYAKDFFLDDLEKSNNYDKLERCLLLYILSTYLENNPQTVDMSLNDYKDTLFQYKKYALASMSKYKNDIHSDIANGILVNAYDRDNNTVHVDSVLYNEWLATGGESETLLGAMLSNDCYPDKFRISDNSERYKQIFETQCELSKVRNNNDVTDTIRDIAVSLYDTMEIVEMERNYLVKNPNAIEKGRQKLYNEIKYMTSKEINDLYYLASVIVAKCRYYYTPAYFLWVDINRLGDENSNIDVREASLLAAINYATDYVMTLVNVDEL